MPATQNDLDSFHHFATKVITGGGRDLSLEDLLQQWRSQRDESETLESIRRGVRDAEQGRVKSLAEVDAAIRADLGFPARS